MPAPRQIRVEMPDETAAPARLLAHTMLGEGARATVLLHGFLGSGRNLTALARGWQKRTPERRFLLPDLPGHGLSPPLAPGDDLDAMARDVLATAAGAGLAPPLTMVGHSLGGRVALAAARVAPEALSEIVLLDITPGPIDAARSASRRVLDVLLQAPETVRDRPAMRAFLTGHGLSPGIAEWLMMNLEHKGASYRWRIDRRALDALHERFNREDLWPVVEAGLAPVRCFRGARSRYVPDDDVRRLEAAGCRVDTVDAGHDLHVEALNTLVDLLGDPG